ncbi:cation diffusion facilitator CzcD-associated flavoprotein CzcO [Antricoccus suffuscus]|uniref:Cation diffusion facilitator CzcD-associated flavoprotein CzcO n=1 Tax=Antricoccus suffuscus TaxID=1629062 RepID=A0A2T1A6G7_9ACTN|nr:NAD(P)/FAD-dependent oxidoreductase [Antricoccus suffuscus]PRZ44191.1 cation diffusion facilitator CzcD-associated flavoprotein CzcO [Antricoccus suffuscus]
MGDDATSMNPDYEVIVVGAGVCGIYQLHRLLDLGFNATLLETGSNLGGTWFWNRYPGARFDSESITYGYSFSEELLQEWDWKERFSGQPENLRYLEYVAEKFDLRPHMQFDCNVDAAVFDDATTQWRLQLSDGRELSSRFLIPALGLLSAPTLPRYDGIDDFEGQAFHTYNWPTEPVTLEGKLVAVVGTGATAIQLIGEIADKVGDLTVFQRRPNWTAPLHNGEISPEEMADIKERYDEIFAVCARTPGGFIHQPDRRPYWDVPREERLAMWEKLYTEPGFGIWLSNFRETFTDEAANAELSAFIADKIRARVNDPVLAEKLVPKDHGFGVQRLPMETHYYEAYNRDNVHLVDLQETPIDRITARGIRTTEAEHEFDIIVFATGFDAVTGAYERVDIRGVGGQSLKEKWADGPATYLGMQVAGFPNMLMPTGPQSASATTNFPRGIELAVDWTTDLLEYMRDRGYTRVEADAESERAWGKKVAELYEIMLLRKAQGWFTGYNSNVEGHEQGKMRYQVYNGGTPKYRATIAEVAERDYEGMQLT